MSPSTTPSTSEASTVRERASLLRDQIHRLRRLKSEASSSLDDIVSRADALDSFLSPLKDKTDELSLGLANTNEVNELTKTLDMVRKRRTGGVTNKQRKRKTCSPEPKWLRRRLP